MHEAVILGSNGLAMVTTLITIGVDVQEQNKRGETAHDMALRINNAVAAELLAANISHKILLQDNQKSKNEEYVY